MLQKKGMAKTTHMNVINLLGNLLQLGKRLDTNKSCSMPLTAPGTEDEIQ